ncbi:galactose metabolism- protein [Entophlyctis luteolus]|nr:galactose metabolism- protein [Entophlyctis luteolus]
MGNNPSSASAGGGTAPDDDRMSTGTGGSGSGSLARGAAGGRPSPSLPRPIVYHQPSSTSSGSGAAAGAASGTGKRARPDSAVLDAAAVGAGDDDAAMMDVDATPTPATMLNPANIRATAAGGRPTALPLHLNTHTPQTVSLSAPTSPGPSTWISQLKANNSNNGPNSPAPPSATSVDPLAPANPLLAPLNSAANNPKNRKDSISGLLAKIGLNTNATPAPGGVDDPVSPLSATFGGGAANNGVRAMSIKSGRSGRSSPSHFNDAQTLQVQKELAEKGYLNSARIVHNYGVGGIAPLAPLSHKKDDKSVIPVMVSWTGGGKTVHITGTFNNWKQKIRLTKSKTDFSTVIDMPAGETHRFKFIVDDEWKCSEDLPIASDSEGNEVNYLDVMDEFGDEIHDGFDGLAHEDPNTSALSESPESSYASKIPNYLSWHLENQQQQLAQQHSLADGSALASAPPRRHTPPPPHFSISPPTHQSYTR